MKNSYILSEINNICENKNNLESYQISMHRAFRLSFLNRRIIYNENLSEHTQNNITQYLSIFMFFVKINVPTFLCVFIYTFKTFV